MAINPRKQKFLNALPKHNYKVAPSAIEAGYSPQYADKAPKRILESALKAQAKDILETASHMDTKEMKKTLADIVGMNRENVFERLRYIANQEKDLSSALKVLAPLAKDLGVNLNTEEAPKTIVPILNIGVRTTDQSTINGSTEPINPANLLSTEYNNDYTHTPAENDVDGGAGINQEGGGA